MLHTFNFIKELHLKFDLSWIFSNFCSLLLIASEFFFEDIIFNSIEVVTYSL